MSLTTRETQILAMVAQGKLNKEIAHSTKISLRSVERHITNIFRKLAVSNRTEAALQYMSFQAKGG